MAKRTRIDVGPSSAHRWSRCTASPQFIIDHASELPDESSFFADEGTKAHDVAAMILTGKPVPEGIDDIMLQYVNGYVAFVRSHEAPKSRRYVEKKIPLFYLPERNGMVDAATMRTDGIYIDDLKYGVGVSVEAEENEQIAIYAESLIRQWEQISDIPHDLPIHLSIYQPRDRNNPEPVRTWTLTRQQLSVFTTTLGAKARQALGGAGLFGPCDKACRFCPAKGICSAYATQGLMALPEEARIITLPDPGALTRDQRVKVLGAKKVLRDWLEAVEDQEVADLMAGKEPQGFKLVEGKSNRQWSDPEAAQTLLSNHLTLDITRPRADLISPHKAEEALKGKELSARFESRFQSLITKPEGKPTLVPESDNRPALQIANLLENIDVI